MSLLLAPFGQAVHPHKIRSFVSHICKSHVLPKPPFGDRLFHLVQFRLVHGRWPPVKAMPFCINFALFAFQEPFP